MPRKIRILSLDGGGIRGVIPGVILSYLELRLRRKHGPDARLADYFDFFAGTSTGGILACGYLIPDENRRPRHTAKDLLDIYLERGDQIFHVSLGHVLAKVGALFEEKYSADALDKAFDDYFGKTRLSELLKPCLVTSYDIRNRRAWLFNQTDGVSETRDFLVRDVARATSAAPTFFEASMIRSRLGTPYALIDGGLVANNPGMCAYAEARTTDFSRVLGDPSAPDKPLARDMVIVSIGTGKITTPYKWKDAKDWGATSWVLPVIDILMSSSAETVDYQLRQIFETTDEPDNYVRLEPELCDASSEMDNALPENLRALQDAGLQFVSDNDTLMDRIVEKLTADGAGPG